MKIISTHDLTKRSTRLNAYEYNICRISTHDLTKRSTTTPLWFYLLGRRFQLTTSRRGRPRNPRYQKWNTHFNSRPHEEVDRNEFRNPLARLKFQLTTSRRGRRKQNNVVSRIYISTHDLTKRSTGFKEELTTKVVVFQLTTSRRGRRDYANEFVMTLIFQLTTSRRGRPSAFIMFLSIWYFNSRPHEEVDLC